MESHELERLNREKQEKTEEELKAEIADRLEYKKQKETLLARIEGSKQLQFLKSLFERGLIAISDAERLVAGKELDSEAVKEIFDKIDEIEKTEKVDSILPIEMRLSKEEYALALTNEFSRAEAIAKLDRALSYLATQANPEGFDAFYAAFSFLSVLNRNLVLVQGNTIDIKRSLT